MSEQIAENFTQSNVPNFTSDTKLLASLKTGRTRLHGGHHGAKKSITLRKYRQ